MNITPNKLSINQLFKNTNEQFVIPSYQRRYAWERAQCKALFDDINMLVDGENHLLGMILCHTGLHTGGLNQSELVDGQQRVTTLSILYLSIKYSYQILKQKEKAAKIDDFLFCSSYDDIKKKKILLGDLDHNDFERVFYQKDLEKVQNEKLLYAFNNFSEWLKDFDLAQLNIFENKLSNAAIMIRLDVSNAKDAYKLFETINNRGLKLSPTDIIKNFILGHAAKHDNIILEEIKSIWSEIIINLDNINTNDFLRQYMCGILGYRIPMSSLVTDFKYYYFKTVEKVELLNEASFYADSSQNETEEDDVDEKESVEEKSIDVVSRIGITDFLQRIKSTSEIYKKIYFRKFSDRKINQHLYNLQRILSFPSYIFLMDLFQRKLDIHTVCNILKDIESFMLRRHICQKRTNELDSIFAGLLKLENENLEAKVRSSLIENMPQDEEFIIDFPKHEFKGKLVDRAKYVLEQFEYDLIKDKGEYVLNSGKDLHLEHIIPIVINTRSSKKEFGDWETYLGDGAQIKHKKFVNRIGNMTLLASELNIKASNNPFNSKKGNYKLSNIRLNESLAVLRDFRFGQVDKRGREMADKAVMIWKL